MALSRFVLPYADVGAGIRPSSGAKLFFYATGTSTPKSTFTDDTGATANTNPVIANANGVFPAIFFNGSFNVALKDSNDVQIWTSDPVTSNALGEIYETTLDLIASEQAASTNDIVECQGYTTKGDGGGAQWRQNGVTGQTVSQSPTQLGDALLNDANGNQWAMLLTNTASFETFALLQSSTSGNVGQKLICRERSNAEYIIQPNSYTALSGDATLASGLVAKLQINNIVLANNFGTINNATIQLAVDRAKAEAITQVFVPLVSSAIEISTAINSADSIIDIDFNGNTLYPTASAFSVVSMAGSFDIDSTNISSLINASVDGAKITQVTTTDYSLFSVGDVVKITCSDLIPDLHASDRKLGQYAVINSITTNTLSLNSEIYEESLYINNLRIGRLNTSSYALRNLKVSNPNNVKPNSLVNILTARDCVFENVTSTNALSTFIQPTNIYRYTAINCGFKNSANDASSAQYGYGINDRSCYKGTIDNFKGSGGRHAVTTNARYNPNAGSNLETGRSYGLTVNSGISTGSRSSSWDTHPGAVYTTFNNCASIDSEVACGGRSPHTVFNNPISKNCASFFRLYPSLVSGNGVDMTINNPTGNCINRFIEYSLGGSSGSNFSNAIISVNGGHVKTRLGQSGIYLGSDFSGTLEDLPVTLTIKGTVFSGEVRGNSGGLILIEDDTDASIVILDNVLINVESIDAAFSGTVKIVQNYKTDNSLATIVNTSITGLAAPFFQAVLNMDNRISNLNVMSSVTFEAGNGTAIPFSFTL
jgi:hypothetical protein